MYIQDICIVRGENFDRELKFTNADGSMIDLGGLNAYAQVRPYAGSNDLTASFTCSVDTTTATVRMSLTPAQTLTMAEGTYAYDFCLVGATTVQYYLGGKFLVRERVTEVA